MTRTRSTLLLALLAALTAAASPASAKPPQQKGQAMPAEAVFSEVERELIRAFFAERRGYRVDSLPPGFQKRLARGKPLPPGLAKRALPGELELRLPSRERVIRQIVGNDVILITAAGIVLDILFDVVKG